MSARVILYVDDNPDDIRITELMFQRLKVRHSLHSARSGREALERLHGVGKYADRAAHPVPEIVLLDLRMPEMDGLQVLASIRKEARLHGLPVFIVTEHLAPQYKERAKQMGASGYIDKPSSMPTFANALAYVNQQLKADMKHEVVVEYVFEG